MDGVFSTKWGNYVARSVDSMVLRCMSNPQFEKSQDSKPGKECEKESGTPIFPSADAMWALQCRLSGSFLNDAAQWTCMDFVIRHYPANAEFQVPASSLRFDQVLQRFIAELSRSDLVLDKKFWTMMPQARLEEICRRLQSCMKRILTKHVRMQNTQAEQSSSDDDAPAVDLKDVRVVELEAGECVGIQRPTSSS